MDFENSINSNNDDLIINERDNNSLKHVYIKTNHMKIESHLWFALLYCKKKKTCISISKTAEICFGEIPFVVDAVFREIIHLFLKRLSERTANDGRTEIA